MEAQPKTDRNKRLNEFRVQTFCLIILSAFALGVGLYLLRPVLVPFTLAVFLAFMLSPVLDIQVRTLRIPRYLALTATLAVGFVGIWFLSGIVVSSVTALAEQSDQFEAAIEARLTELEGWLEGFLDRSGEFDGETEPAPATDDVPIPTDPDSRFGESVPVDESSPPNPFDLTSLLPENFFQMLMNRFATTIGGLVSQGVLVLLFVIFLLLGRATPQKRIQGVGLEIETSVKRYIITKVVVSAMTGGLVYLTLNILDVRFAAGFGALAFLLNFIPSIGSIVSTFLPLTVLLLDPETPLLKFALVFAIPGGIQFAIGNVVEPKFMGDSLDLHPVVILLALIFWGMIWGPIGMLLAAPLTAITKIVLSKIEVTEPIANLLAGRLDLLYTET